MRRPDADRAGVVASTLCAVHCLMGALFAGLSGLGPTLAGPRIELAFASSAIALGLVALVRGLRRHGSWTPAVVGGCGIGCLALGRVVDIGGATAELASSLAGGGLLVTAHVINIRRLRCAEACCASSVGVRA